MNRSKVIVHMYISMDGKIVTDLPGYPNNLDCQKGGDLYDALDYELGEAWGCGRTTFQSDVQVDLTPFENSLNDGEDNPIISEHYCVVFDRKGRLYWDTPYMEYGGHKCQIIEVVTKQASNAYLNYLKSMGIAYMICGESDLDIPCFLEKLYHTYQVKTFVLCGGAEINAAFMASDLVDEVSLVMIPGVQGGRSELTFVGSEDVTKFPKYFNLKSVTTPEKNVVHLRYVRKED